MASNSWFSNLLPAIQNLPSKVLGLNSFAPNVDLPEGASLGGLANNAISGVGNIAGAVGNIPNDITTAAKDPSTILPAIGNYAKGTVEQVGNIIQHPIRSFYNDPVGTTLTALPVIGAAGKVLKGAEEATAGTVAGESGATTLGNRFLRGQYKATPSTMEDFTPEHLNQLADWGITTPKQVIQAHDMFTGGDGVATQLVRSAVAKAKPVNPAGLDDIAKGIMQQTYGLTPADEAKFITNTSQQFASKVPNKTGITNGMPDIATKDPLETYDFTQNLKKTASKLSGSRNLTDQAMGSAYRSFAQELDNRLFVDSGANNVLNNSQIDPATMAKISAISPKLAQDTQGVIQNGTVGDLKHLQQSLITGNNAAVETAGLAKGSPMSLRNVLAMYIGLHNPAVAGTILMSNTGVGENMLGKTFRGAGETISKANQAGIPAKASLALGTLPNIGPMPSNQEKNNDQKQNQSVIPPTQSVAPKTPDVNNLPQSAQDVQVEDNGNISLLNPYMSGLAIPETGASNSYTSQKTNLTNQLNTYLDQAKADQYKPQSLFADQQNITKTKNLLDNLETQHTTSKDIGEPYNNTKVVVSAGKQAISDLSKSDSNLFQSNGTINDTLFKTDKKYSGLVGAIDNLQKIVNQYGSGLIIYQPGMTSDVLKSNIKQAEAVAAYNIYYSKLGGSYTGGSTNIATPPPTNGGQLPPIATPPAKTGGQEASYQFTPPNPGWGQLPPIQ